MKRFLVTHNIAQESIYHIKRITGFMGMALSLVSSPPFSLEAIIPLSLPLHGLLSFLSLMVFSSKKSFLSIVPFRRFFVVESKNLEIVLHGDGASFDGKLFESGRGYTIYISVNGVVLEWLWRLVEGATTSFKDNEF